MTVVSVNEANFEEETKEGLVLLDFYADWCGPCRALAPTLEQLTDVKVVKVNVDENKELSQTHNVSAIPKLVFMKDGETVETMSGVQSQQALQTKIDELK